MRMYLWKWIRLARTHKFLLLFPVARIFFSIEFLLCSSSQTICWSVGVPLTSTANLWTLKLFCQSARESILPSHLIFHIFIPNRKSERWCARGLNRWFSRNSIIFRFSLIIQSNRKWVWQWIQENTIYLPLLQCDLLIRPDLNSDFFHQQLLYRKKSKLCDQMGGKAKLKLLYRFVNYETKSRGELALCGKNVPENRVNRKKNH